jgi:hypothetical protein
MPASLSREKQVARTLPDSDQKKNTKKSTFALANVGFLTYYSVLEVGLYSLTYENVRAKSKSSRTFAVFSKS